ncbi:MAG: DUF1987 family protein [Sphingobacteriaceae bacterium]|nr:DUF1987 family protein [Sphingobacteriaceae bacterium]
MVIPQTQHTPLVVASEDEGIISIKGKIIPENPDEFFNQLEVLTEQCIIKTKNENISLNIQLDYFNTTSSKMLAKYFKSLLIKQPQINWHYEKGDDSIKEAGEDYSSMLNFPFNIIEI